MRPLIGINLDFECEPFPRSVLRETYYDAVSRAGGCPVLLPPIADPEVVEAHLAHVDGIVLTGGDDIDPQHFGEERHPACKLLPRRRQDYDLALTRAAIERGVPTLAICCGMQCGNVVRGGSLIQDIPTALQGALVHSSGNAAKNAEHEVSIERGTRLHEILGADKVLANSAHHQSCGRIGKGLRVTAHAPDGVVEAWEDPTHPFLIGVQWHPERIVDRPPHLNLFRALVDAARARRKK
jgi:putative glutamine amidotransferase